MIWISSIYSLFEGILDLGKCKSVQICQQDRFSRCSWILLKYTMFNLALSARVGAMMCHVSRLKLARQLLGSTHHVCWRQQMKRCRSMLWLWKKVIPVGSSWLRFILSIFAGWWIHWRVLLRSFDQQLPTGLESRFTDCKDEASSQRSWSHLNVAGECWLVYFKSCECLRPDLILAPTALSLNVQQGMLHPSPVHWVLAIANNWEIHEIQQVSLPSKYTYMIIWYTYIC